MATANKKQREADQRQRTAAREEKRKSKTRSDSAQTESNPVPPPKTAVAQPLAEVKASVAKPLVVSAEASVAKPEPALDHLGDGVLPEIVKVIGPGQASEIKVGTVIYIDPARVAPDPTQPRKDFASAALERLANSIKHDGQTEPAHVFRFEDSPDHDVVLINGERRWRACKMIGFPLLAFVKSVPLSKRMKVAQQLTSNVNKEDLGPIELAQAIKDLLDEGMEISEICRVVGKTEGPVRQYLRFLGLDPGVQAMMSMTLSKKKRIGPGVGAVIAKLPLSQQLGTAQTVIAEGLTIRQVRLMVRNMLSGSGAEDPTTRRSRRPANDRELLESYADMVASRALEFTDELGPEVLKRMFEFISPGQHFLVVTRLERAINNLIVLREMVKECGPSQDGDDEEEDE
jgi:ParB family chromosome partitioning protein